MRLSLQPGPYPQLARRDDKKDPLSASVQTSVQRNAGAAASWAGEGPFALAYDGPAQCKAAGASSTPRLLLELRDKDTFTKDDRLGDAELPLLPLCAYPGAVFRRTLRLGNAAAGRQRNGELTVEAQFVPAGSEGVKVLEG